MFSPPNHSKDHEVMAMTTTMKLTMTRVTTLPTDKDGGNYDDGTKNDVDNNNDNNSNSSNNNNGNDSHYHNHDDVVDDNKER